MNIIWTLFVCSATCLLSDVVGSSFDTDQLFRPHAISEISQGNNHSVLILFRNGTGRNDIAHFCRGVQVKHENKAGDISVAFLVTSADCILDFPANRKGEYQLYLTNEQGEWSADHTWPKSGALENFVIHPQFNHKALQHNIAVFLHGLLSYTRDLVELPDNDEVFEGKAMVVSGWTDRLGERGPVYDTRVQNLPTNVVNSNWCKYLYPFSPLRGFEICVSGWNPDNRQIAVGEVLTYQGGAQNTTTILAGIATIARPRIVGLPIEFSSIQPYVSWLKNEARAAYNT